MISGLYYFDSWLNRSTWYTSHDTETTMFYQALKKIIAENPGVLIHEHYVRDYILTQKNTTLPNSTLIATAEKYGKLAEDISEYILKTK